MLFLASNTRQDIYYSIHDFLCFHHNTKASHQTSSGRIWLYLQGTNNKGIVLKPFNRMVVNFYVYEDFMGTRVHDNHQFIICYKSRT